MKTEKIRILLPISEKEGGNQYDRIKMYRADLCTQ